MSEQSEQTYTAHYWRYHAQDEQQFDTLGEAVGFLAGGWEAGECTPISVVGPDGDLVLTGDALDAEIMKRVS